MKCFLSQSTNAQPGIAKTGSDQYYRVDRNNSTFEITERKCRNSLPFGNTWTVNCHAMIVFRINITLNRQFTNGNKD